MKRFAVKDLIERYFYQMQRGCGNPKCSNINCASSGKLAPMSANEIAAKALILFSQDAELCEPYTQPHKVPGTGTQNEFPTSSRLADNFVAVDVNEKIDSYSTSDHNNCGSSTSNSSISCGTSSSRGVQTLDTNLEAETASINVIATNCADTCKSFDELDTLDFPKPTTAPVEYLNEQIIDEILENCKKTQNYDSLINAINIVFRSVKELSKSFCRPPLAKLTSPTSACKLQEVLGKSPQNLKKEDLRILEGEHDKDEDSTCLEEDENDDSLEQFENDVNNDDASTSSHAVAEVGMGTNAISLNISDIAECIEPMDEDDKSNNGADIVEWTCGWDTQVDFESLRRVKKKLCALQSKAVREAINESIIILAESIDCFHSYDWEQVLHCFVICFDMSLTYFDYMELSMPVICYAVQVIPIEVQAKLARIWAMHCKDYLHSIVQSLQQLIALQVAMDEYTVQGNTDIIALTKVLKIVFYANILAGESDTYNTSASAKKSIADIDSAASSNDANDIFYYNQTSRPYHKTFADDKLEKELNISVMDCRVPFVPFEEFYNEPLSDAIQMDTDYLSYKNLLIDPLAADSHFSFMLYSFILTPATKVIALYYDSRIRMYNERNATMQLLLYCFGDNNDVVAEPHLKIKVRRDNIVNDALMGLELVAMSSPKDLKKQLVVEFAGEQGIDEGGVSKEFFQLIVEEVFNPDFGMFTYQEDTNTTWFNSTAYENEAQFTLIGIIIGLAIYNNIILAVNFPMVVYRKLMGGRGSFYDLNDWNPTLYRSLKSMLEYEEPDMEEVFMQTFKINYKNVFDEIVEHELKPGGGEILVNQSNKQEFVDLYSDFLLNKNIERQFKAFRKGFEMVTDESPLKLLFRPEEIELLVCGSKKFEFIELEKTTEYEGGFTGETQIIKDFWSIVHNLPEISKRKLLQFTTGSDRVPVGGLSRIKLLITRQGPDSDRLPTSHTCFNVLLLPEYNSKEKLEERLLKAINYSKGFGLL